jgi:hypothetical protein
MTDEPRKIIVDDDWKAEARREKERLAEAEAQSGPDEIPPASLLEIVNLITMQALAGMGLMAGPRGERIPPNFEAAKHFIDLLQVLADKTKGNLSDEESQTLDGVLYELRMRFVEMASGGAAAPGAVPPPTPPGA